jgi:hypothetical protein
MVKLWCKPSLPTLFIIISSFGPYVASFGSFNSTVPISFTHLGQTSYVIIAQGNLTPVMLWPDSMDVYNKVCLILANNPSKLRDLGSYKLKDITF